MAPVHIKYSPPAAFAYVEYLGLDEGGRKLFRVWRWNCLGEMLDYPTGFYLYPTWGPDLKLGMISFITLKMLRGGCCPPQLLKEFIETERFDSESGDAVEEAMKLHKRGYLGVAG